MWKLWPLLSTQGPQQDPSVAQLCGCPVPSSQPGQDPPPTSLHTGLDPRLLSDNPPITSPDPSLSPDPPSCVPWPKQASPHPHHHDFCSQLARSWQGGLQACSLNPELTMNVIIRFLIGPHFPSCWDSLCTMPEKCYTPETPIYL